MSQEKSHFHEGIPYYNYKLHAIVSKSVLESTKNQF